MKREKPHQEDCPEHWGDQEGGTEQQRTPGLRPRRPLGGDAGSHSNQTAGEWEAGSVHSHKERWNKAAVLVLDMHTDFQ